MKRPAVTLALLGALVALGATETLADFRAPFREGVRAVERRQWERALGHLEEAIAANPTSGETVLLYGRRFVRYLPYWYLGLAKYHLGDRRGAAEAWRRELDQGAIQGASSEYSELQALWPEVEGLLAREPPPRQPDAVPSPAALAAALSRAEAALEQARQAAGAVGEVTGRSGFDAVLAAEPGLRRDLEQAEGRLRRAREGLDRGRRDGNLEAVGTAATLAEEAHQAYAGLLARARQGLEAVELAQQQERERRQQVERDRIAEEQRQAEERRLAEAEVQIAEAEEAAEAERARQAEARGGPPAELVNAARAYFAADYRRALELLSAFHATEDRARAQAHLFRAAAGFTLSQLMLGAASDELEQARREIQALLDLDPAFRPDPVLFSPRFVRFFEQIAG